MTPAEVVLGTSAVSFRIGGESVGEYVVDDPYKPYLHPLRTPRGRVVSLALPWDHGHHKGLMYALTTTDVNWWEESLAHSYVPVIGVQRQESLEAAGPGGIAQSLLWTAEDGSLPTFQERRELSCALHPDGFVRWTWRARFDVLRDVTLRHSPGAIPDSAGIPVNYHGLGIRFPRTFGWGGSIEVSADGEPIAAPEAMGTRPRSIVVNDYVDGEYPPPRVSVRVTQTDTRHAVFTLADPFAYLSIGPSVAALVELREGDRLDESYLVDVADGSLASVGL